MSAYTNHGKTTSAKRNSGENQHSQKEIVVHSVGLFKKNHRTTEAQVTAELNIYLDDPVSTKTVRRNIYKSNIHGRAAIAKHLITEYNAQIRK
jgi:hypothetical protein